jgi:hypothetical protein
MVLFHSLDKSYKKLLFDMEWAECKRNDAVTMVILGSVADANDDFKNLCGVPKLVFPTAADNEALIWI